MNRRTLLAASAGLALVAGGAGTAVAVSTPGNERSADLRRAIDPKKPKNVIMIVGDGTGESELTAARYYRGVGKGPLALDALPFRGVATTWSVRDRKGSPDYVPDSASTATAWSTGVKTLDNRISQRPTNRIEAVGGNDLPTTIDLAKRAGKRTGNVSTAEITDATPAAPSSRISQRACQGPDDTRKTCPAETRERGGLGSIAEQQVRQRADVTLGGGRNRYEQRTDRGRTVLEQAQRDGYQVVSDAAGLAGVRNVRTAPVLGLFTPSNMTVELDGPQAAAGGNTATCKTGNRPANEPSLADMTRKAIELLDKGNPNGFFLQAEGASIDKQAHAANPCRQIGETLALDEAVKVAQEFQRRNPDTLIVVSADHSHTGQIVSEESTGDGAPTGYFQDLTTGDGQPLRIAYGTAGGATRPNPAPSQEHTGAAVPVLASGPQAANVTGTLDQTDLFPLLSGQLRR